MKILITGGAGFLGQRLARRSSNAASWTAADQRTRAARRGARRTDFGDKRVRAETGDIADRSVLERAIDADTRAIFHLAAIVSGQAEADFDLGMRINLDASRQLLDSLPPARSSRRACCSPARSRSTAATLPDVVHDDTALNPQSSYGTQKAIAELLLNDYARRGFVDGRVLRLPTISVRPGKPNAAASSFASGIIREPLNGERAVARSTAKPPLAALAEKAIEA